VEKVYFETCAVNKLLKNPTLIPVVKDWLAARVPLISEVVLLELSSTSNQVKRRSLLQLIQGLLGRPSTLVVVQAGQIRPVIRGIPIVASPWELFRREVKAFTSNSSEISLVPGYPHWQDYIMQPEKVDNETARRLREKKVQEEKEWRHLHKRAREIVRQENSPEGEFLRIATSSEGRNRFFETLFGKPIEALGCPVERIFEFFEASTFCRAFYYEFAYWIDRYGIKGTGHRQLPRLDAWDVLQVGYLAYSDIAVCGEDLINLFSWVTEKAETHCKIMDFESFMKRKL